MVSTDNTLFTGLSQPVHQRRSFWNGFTRRLVASSKNMVETNTETGDGAMEETGSDDLPNYSVKLRSSEVLHIKSIAIQKAIPVCQIRSSPVCMVMNKLPSHPPVFILTPSQRPTLICIHTTDLITSSYSTII
jgi:hypothetical protein